MIALENVSKSFGPVEALHTLSLRLPAGETSVLIGPSGCGKSTILRLIVGLIQTDTGTIHIDGEPITRDNVLRLRRRMGYVIQEGGLFPHLTARRNVTLMARQLGWSEAEIDARVAELADLVHLPEERLRDFPGQLSGGQRQRVSLMRALMLDPDVLLLDEPLGALDPMIRAGLQDELREIFERLGKTVVMVTHDIGEAAHFAGRIILLRQGRIVQSGALRELLHQPADPFVEEFIRAQRAPLEA